jgi:hypothetical protein
MQNIVHVLKLVDQQVMKFLQCPKPRGYFQPAAFYILYFSISDISNIFINKNSHYGVKIQIKC